MIQLEQDRLRLALRRRAMDLLARREHAREELVSKLAKVWDRIVQRQALPERALDETLLTEVLDKLEQDGLLSDARFLESYLNARINRGYGPLYVRHQLRQKRVDSDLLERHLAQLDPEFWLDVLSELIQSRCRSSAFPACGSKDYLKLQRFALSRGFTSAQWFEAEKRWRASAPA